MPGRTYTKEGTRYQTLAVEITVEDHRSLRIAAAEESVSLSKLMRQVVEDYLNARYGVPEVPVEGEYQESSPTE